MNSEYSFPHDSEAKLLSSSLGGAQTTIAALENNEAPTDLDMFYAANDPSMVRRMVSSTLYICIYMLFHVDRHCNAHAERPSWHEQGYDCSFPIRARQSASATACCFFSQSRNDCVWPCHSCSCCKEPGRTSGTGWWLLHATGDCRFRTKLSSGPIPSGCEYDVSVSAAGSDGDERLQIRISSARWRWRYDDGSSCDVNSELFSSARCSAPGNGVSKLDGWRRTVWK